MTCPHGPLPAWSRRRLGLCFPMVLVVLLTVVCGPGTSYCQGAGPTWGGRFKTLDLYLQKAPEQWAEGGGLSANSLRLTMQSKLPHALDLEVAVEADVLAAAPDDLSRLPTGSEPRILDLTATWGQGRSVSGRVQVDRLCLRGRSTDFEWAVGRQAIGFGRILLFSPLDVIAPFAPDAIDTEIRPGVDALNLTGYFGHSGELGAYAVMADRFSDWSGLLTFSINTHEIDLLGIGGLMRDRPMGGIGLAGDVGGLGLKGEIAVYAGKQLSRPGGDLHAMFAIAAIEGSYRFANGLVLTGEYLYNGAGADHPDAYLRALDSAPVREGLSYLLGRHYLLLAPTYEIHPLVTLSGLIIWNVQDLSCLLRPAATISLSDNLSLMLFWAINAGRSPRSPFIARSEFGSRGDGGGVFLAWHF